MTLSAEKVQMDQVKTLILFCTNMAGTTLVPRVANVFKTITISDFLEEKSFEQLDQVVISTEKDSNISCVDYYRRLSMPYWHFAASFHTYLNLEKGGIFIRIPVILEEVV